MSGRPFVLAGLLVALGCEAAPSPLGGGVDLGAPDTPAPSPDAGAAPDARARRPAAAVVPEQLNFFGSLIAPSRRAVVVTNAGSAPLEVSGAWVEPPASPFVLVPPPESGLLPAGLAPGEAIALGVGFPSEPLEEGFAVEATLYIRTSDPVAPERQVRLQAEDRHCCRCEWSLATTTLDLGGAVVGTRLEGSVVARNTSARWACGLRFVPEGGCEDFVVEPLVLPPTSTAAARILFSPRRAGTQTCRGSLVDQHVYGQGYPLVLTGAAIAD